MYGLKKAPAETSSYRKSCFSCKWVILYQQSHWQTDDMGHLFRMPRPSGQGQSMGYTCTPVKIKETGADAKLCSMKYYVYSLAANVQLLPEMYLHQGLSSTMGYTCTPGYQKCMLPCLTWPQTETAQQMASPSIALHRKNTEERSSGPKDESMKQKPNCKQNSRRGVHLYPRLVTEGYLSTCSINRYFLPFSTLCPQITMITDQICSDKLVVTLSSHLWHCTLWRRLAVRLWSSTHRDTATTYDPHCVMQPHWRPVWTLSSFSLQNPEPQPVGHCNRGGVGMISPMCLALRHSCEVTGHLGYVYLLDLLKTSWQCNIVWNRTVYNKTQK